jgi:hypothetical protein
MNEEIMRTFKIVSREVVPNISDKEFVSIELGLKNISSSDVFLKKITYDNERPHPRIDIMTVDVECSVPVNAVVRKNRTINIALLNKEYGRDRTTKLFNCPHFLGIDNFRTCAGPIGGEFKEQPMRGKLLKSRFLRWDRLVLKGN